MNFRDIFWICLLFVVAILLTGCSSTQPVKTTQRQYCYTSQEIVTKDKEQVSSKTMVKCNDDPVEQMVIRKAGIANNCGQFKNRMTVGGKYREEVGIACQKFDGTWEVMPHPSLLK